MFPIPETPNVLLKITIFTSIYVFRMPPIKWIILVNSYRGTAEIFSCDGAASLIISTSSIALDWLQDGDNDVYSFLGSLRIKCSLVESKVRDTLSQIPFSRN